MQTYKFGVAPSFFFESQLWHEIQLSRPAKHCGTLSFGPFSDLHRVSWKLGWKRQDRISSVTTRVSIPGSFHAFTINTTVCSTISLATSPAGLWGTQSWVWNMRQRIQRDTASLLVQDQVLHSVKRTSVSVSWVYTKFGKLVLTKWSLEHRLWVGSEALGSLNTWDGE